MKTYRCGDSTLRLDGRTDDPVLPGTTFEFEFSPEQEAQLLACGAITVATPARRQVDHPSADVSGDSMKEKE